MDPTQRASEVDTFQSDPAAAVAGEFQRGTSAEHARFELSPVAREERIRSVDVLRGFAVLGILLMNIVGFGFYAAAYVDPTVAGGATGANLWAWTIMHVVADGKMRCLFSMIFGASAILLLTRLQASGNAADVYYRRTFWLMLFGILHAYLLWYGDILYPYALCALLLYPFRKLPGRKLLLIAAVLIVVNSAVYAAMGFAERSMLAAGPAAVRASQQGKQLTEEQQSAKTDYEQWRKIFRPIPEELQRDANRWRGNALSIIEARAKVVAFFHFVPYYAPMNLDIWCMMFAGMGLMKLGVLSAQRSWRFYRNLLWIGYGIGIPVNLYTAFLIIRSNFDPVVYSFTNSIFDLARLLVAAGHLAAVMLVVKAGVLRWLSISLAAVGQMAFSNYVLQSLVATVIFTGCGFGLYGRLERYQLYYIVACVWVVELLVSRMWLEHFRFGPLEWCWRSLTYWKRHPMRSL